MAADIVNAYLTAEIKEKYWVKCEPEFGINEGRIARVVWALYGTGSRGHLPVPLREAAEDARIYPYESRSRSLDEVGSEAGWYQVL